MRSIHFLSDHYSQDELVCWFGGKIAKYNTNRVKYFSREWSKVNCKNCLKNRMNDLLERMALFKGSIKNDLNYYGTQLYGETVKHYWRLKK